MHNNDDIKYQHYSCRHTNSSYVEIDIEIYKYMK